MPIPAGGLWPPTLADYKLDLKLDADDVRYDEALQVSLDAAIAYVERVRSDVNFYDDPLLTGEAVSADLVLGTLRYARRLDIRRDTPVGMFVAGAVGSTGLAQWDADTERLLRTGKYARLRFGQ